MSCKPEPAICSCDNDQRIPCFDSCQLTIIIGLTERYPLFGPVTPKILAMRRVLYFGRLLFSGHAGSFLWMFTWKAWRQQIAKRLICAKFRVSGTYKRVQGRLAWESSDREFLLINPPLKNQENCCFKGKTFLCDEKIDIETHRVCNRLQCKKASLKRTVSKPTTECRC